MRRKFRPGDFRYFLDSPGEVGRAQPGLADPEDLWEFKRALKFQMERHSETASQLASALARMGVRTGVTTLRQWASGAHTPRTVKSAQALSCIERRYRLAPGYFERKLLDPSRGIVGHEKLLGVTKHQRDRLRWHLPDDFDSRPKHEREEIMEWVRTVMIAGATGYRRYQRNAVRFPYALRFIGLGCEPHDPLDYPCLEEARTGKSHVHSGEKGNAPLALNLEVANLVHFKSAVLLDVGLDRNTAWSPATARGKVKQLGLFFGALAASRSSPVIGHGVQREHLTIALLAFPAVLDWYIEWTRSRRGFFTAWEMHYLRFAASLGQPRTGWLRQNPALAQRLRVIPGLISEADIDLALRDWDGVCDRLVSMGMPECGRSSASNGCTATHVSR